MKIAFCDNSLKELINFRGDVINHFADEGKTIILVAPNNFKDLMLRESIRLYTPNLERSGMNPFKDIRYMVELIKIYRREKPDLIFHYTIKPNIYGAIVAKILGIPSIAIITGLGYAFNHNEFKTKVARALYRFSMRFPKKVFVLNRNNMETLEKFGILSINKVILLPGGEGVNLDVYK